MLFINHVLFLLLFCYWCIKQVTLHKSVQKQPVKTMRFQHYTGCFTSHLCLNKNIIIIESVQRSQINSEYPLTGLRVNRCSSVLIRGDFYFVYYSYRKQVQDKWDDLLL